MATDSTLGPACQRFPAAFVGRATGIGSLPHRIPDEAVTVALWADVPYWPQLPQRHASEDMRQQFTAPGAALLPDRAAGLWALAAALGDRRVPALKGQLTGPVTLAASGIALAPEALAAKAAWQVTWLKRWADEVLLVIDEPALGQVADGDREQAGRALAALIAAIRQAGGTAGLHVCGPADWEWAAGFGWDVLGFDLADGPPLGLLARQVMRGGGILWGCLPTDRDPDLDWARQQLSLRWHAGALPPETWYSAAMFSPACGLGLLPLARAERISQALSTLTAVPLA